MAALLLRLIALAIVTLHAGTAASAGPVNVGETRRSLSGEELVRTVASPPPPALTALVCRSEAGLCQAAQLVRKAVLACLCFTPIHCLSQAHWPTRWSVRTEGSPHRTLERAAGQT